MKAIKLGLVVLLVAVIAIGGLFAGGAPEADPDKFTIGFTFHSSRIVFQQMLLDAFQEEAAEYDDVEVLVIDPEVDIERQLTAIETFIAQDVDVIVASPLDFDGTVPGVRAANEAGIPFIALNTMVGGGEFTYAGSADVEAGMLQGEYLREELPEGAKVLYLRGEEGMFHTGERRRGVQEALLDERPDIELLSEMTANYVRTEGMQVMEDWIETYPEFDAVIAANDEMALGAIEALRGAGLEPAPGSIYVTGIDANPDAIEAIREGTMAMTVFQDAKAQAREAFRLAMKVRDGEPLPDESIIPFTPITAENVDEYF